MKEDTNPHQITHGRNERKERGGTLSSRVNPSVYDGADTRLENLLRDLDGTSHFAHTVELHGTIHYLAT